MYHFTMTIICSDTGLWWKDVESLTSSDRDEDVISHHVPESSGIDLGSHSNQEGLMVTV